MTKKAWVCHANTDPCALMRASSTQGHMTGITKKIQKCQKIHSYNYIPLIFQNSLCAWHVSQETFSLFVMAFDANRLKNMTYCVIVGNLYYRVMHSSFMEDFQNYNIYR